MSEQKPRKVSFFAVSEALSEKLLSEGCVENGYHCDVAVIGTEGVRLSQPLVAQTVIYVPGTEISGDRLLCDEIVSVSMAHNASVTLTGICDDRCMLAFERTVTCLSGEKIEPCETGERYDNALSPEENMLFLTVMRIMH